MSTAEVTQFLRHLAVNEQVTTTSQNQALNTNRFPSLSCLAIISKY